MAEGGSHSQRIIQVTDKLQFDFYYELGRGMWSTVYKGSFEDMPVAVKRIKCKDTLDAQERMTLFKNSREIKIMNTVETDRHRNIIGYYVSDIQEDYMYIALELCQGSLVEYVKSKDLKASYTSKKVNNDIASGVDFLHSRNIVHRDLKPENVYFITKGGCIQRIVIGDFGTSKCTVNDMCTLSGTSGTCGYIAVDVWDKMSASDDENANIKHIMTTKSDIFALGCVFYFTATHGLHPFGNKINRQVNIQTRIHPTFEECILRDDPLKHLLIEMLSHNPDVRPTAREVKEHPAFWSAERTLNFLSDASDELMNSDSATRSRVENPNIIRDGNWMIGLPINMNTYLHNYAQENKSGRRVNIYRKNDNSVFGLLRAIRNVVSHHRQFPSEVLEELGKFPEGHAQLWMQLFPLLLMHVVRTVKDNTKSRLFEQLNDRYVLVPIQTTGTKVEALPRPKVMSITSNSSPSDALSTALADTHQISSPHPEMTSQTEENSISDSCPPTKWTFGLSTILSTSLDTLANRYPVVLRQTERHYKPDVSYWEKAIEKEITDASGSCLYNIEGNHMVLCIDISESMSEGQAWSQTKRFVEDMLEGLRMLDRQSNYVSIATFGHKTEVVIRLSNDFDELLSVFNSITLGGPTPMFGGLMFAYSTLAAFEDDMEMSILVMISDCKPTETTLVAGIDTADEKYIDETRTYLHTCLEEFQDVCKLVVVPVGNFDETFLESMIDVSCGQRLSYEKGKTLTTGVLDIEKLVLVDDMYNENHASILVIGSRVTLGPDWNGENEEDYGPGTVIGHKIEDTCTHIWVEWDNNGHKECYRYGFENCYDIIPTDKAREVSESGLLKVGNIVSLGKDSSGLEQGTVVRIENNGEFHVRWESGGRGEYSMGEGGVFAVCTRGSKDTTPKEPNPKDPSDHLASARPAHKLIHPKQGRHKNQGCGKSRHAYDGHVKE